MRVIQTSIIAILSVIVTATLLSGTAYAITGNYQPDNTRNNVALLIFYNIDDSGNKIPVALSSGILLSPRVVLTAAHCCITQTVSVIFDGGPISANIANNQILPQGVTTVYDGIAIPNPDYATNIQGKNGAPAFSYRDVAIVVLKEPVPESVVSQYGQLPESGFVDTLPVNTDVTLAGFGFQKHLAPRNMGVKNTWAGMLVRNSASAKLLSGNFAWSDEFIRCSANPGKGKGGIAFGDSGGPVFLGGTNTVLAVNSFVTNPNCAGETYHSRIDIPEVLNWIKQEVNVNG